MPMKVDRRVFLHLLASPLLIPGLALRARAEAADAALFLLVDGIGPTTPPDQLSAVLNPLLEGEIPFGLVLSAPGASGSALSDAVADYLRRILVAAPDRVEPVLSLPGLAGLTPYFQRRAASDSIEWLSTLVADATLPPPLTIATDPPDLRNFDALRSLGVRGVLNLGARPPVSSTGCASLAVCLDGATTIEMAAIADPAAPINAALDRRGWAQIVLSLTGLDQASVSDLRVRGQRTVDALSREMQRGRHFMALPRDHALWFGEDQSRYIAIRLAAVPEAGAAARSRLVAEIRALGIPFSDSVLPGTLAGGPWPDDACLDLSAAPLAEHALALPPTASLRCATAGSPTAPLPPGVETALDLLLVPGADAAFDGRGLLIRAETPVAEAAILMEDRNRMRDAVLSIGPQDYATPAALSATLDTLRGLRADTATRLVDLPTLQQATVTADPVLDLLRASRRTAVEPPDPDPITAEDWMADARQAWTFFERFSNPDTGLCIDMADVQGDDQWLHRELTMWDLGSLIAAVLAAHELGLLPDADFIARADHLVRALPVTEIAGRLLPSEVISTDTGRSLSYDFNACDTGRLLSVLRDLDAHPLTRGLAEATTRRWDLGTVIVEGRIHSVVNGALVDRFRSHCAHYTARAFRDRGFAAASPYEVPDQGLQTDREMRLLQALDGMGALGAEPLLFEALEMGMSEPSSLLASVLFSAQRHEFETTGTLHCASEAALNREPWFSYQGLNLTPVGDRWIVNVPSNDARFNTPDFRKEIALVNTKAAYLWAAYRPGPYSTQLARHVRTRARLDGLGFAPGVFAATGETMPGYTDVNTNGVVLEAIAFILRGRKRRFA